MSDIHDLHPQKPDAQEKSPSKKRGAANESDRTDVLKAKLQALLSEHRDLDDVIERLGDDKPFDQLKLQRLKKRKLALKDDIAKLRSQILPDIIA